MNCNEAVAALVASLETGSPMTDSQREHIRTCDRCKELLDSAKEFQSALTGNGHVDPSMDATLTAAEGEVRRRRIRRLTKAVIGVAIVAAIGAMVMFLTLSRGITFTSGLAALAMGVFMAAAIAVPPLVIIALVRSVNRGTRPRLYKRLKPGRQISGVCLGIAETFGLNVTLVRLLFVLLFFFDGLGFWVYIILDLAMPVHPDDRQHLLRFRLRRWWQRRTAHANHGTG